MKKVLLALIFLCIPILAFGAGSCTTTVTDSGIFPISILTYSCTGDSSTGTIPATASNPVYGWVFMVKTIPGTGAAAPTNNYSLTLSDSDGIDIMGGGLASRSSTNPQQFLTGRVVSGTLTLAASGQSVASATWTVKVWIYAEKQY